MRRMGAKRAWLYLASIWDNPVECPVMGYDYYGAIAKLRFLRGLCGSVRLLIYTGMVSWNTGNKMNAALATLRRGRKGYWWSNTQAGAKRRAACCRRLAEKS